MGEQSDRPAYENAPFWTKRLEQDFSLAGVGHASVGLAFNRWAYKVRRSVLLREMLQQGVKPKGASLLELGFGTGFYLDLWRDCGVKFVSGYDITDIAVANARIKFGDLGWQFGRADIGQRIDLGEREGKYDIATAFDVLFHLVDDGGWNTALANLSRALKPGGHVIIFDKMQPFESAAGHVKRRTLDTYTAALKTHGFETLSVNPLFVLMNSPTAVTGWRKMGYRAAWSLSKLPYRLGKLVGAGEFMGNLSGAALYGPELLLTRLVSQGPSTKILIARKLP